MGWAGQHAVESEEPRQDCHRGIYRRPWREMAIIIPWTPLPSAWKATIIKRDMANMAQRWSGNEAEARPPG